MTNRQTILVFYLREHPGWNRSEDILTNLQDYYNYNVNCKNMHDTPARNWLTKDIAEIRNSTDAAIISSPRGIKLGTAEENIRYHVKLYNKAKRKIGREYRVLKELNAEGQIDIDGLVKEIIESNG